MQYQLLPLETVKSRENPADYAEYKELYDNLPMKVFSKQEFVEMYINWTGCGKTRAVKAFDRFKNRWKVLIKLRT